MQPALGPMSEAEMCVVVLSEALLFIKGEPLNRTNDVRRHFSHHHCAFYSAVRGVYLSWARESLLDQSPDLFICSRWVWLPGVVRDVASSHDSCFVHYSHA